MFAAGSREFFVERAGAPHATWRAVDGGPLPALPPVRAAAAFHLGLLDLHKAAASGDDQALAGEVRSRMAGGYDIPRLLDGDLFRLPAKRLAAETAAQEARQAVEQIRREFDAVAIDESRLPDLERRLQRGKDAEQRRRILELAGRCAQARRRAATAAASLAALPPVLQKLRGDESERRARLTASMQDDAATIATATAAIERAQDDLAATDLATPPSPSLLAEARTRVSAIRDDDALVRRGAEELAAALAAAAERGRHLDPAWPPDRRETCRLDDLAAAEALVRDLGALDAQEQAVANQLARAASDAENPDAAPLHEALSHLAAWLAVPDAAGRGRPWWPAVLASAVLIAAAVGWFMAGGGVLASLAGAVGVALLGNRAGDVVPARGRRRAPSSRRGCVSRHRGRAAGNLEPR